MKRPIVIDFELLSFTMTKGSTLRKVMGQHLSIALIN